MRLFSLKMYFKYCLKGGKEAVVNFGSGALQSMENTKPNPFALMRIRSGPNGRWR